jgi:hypothetical protein
MQSFKEEHRGSRKNSNAEYGCSSVLSQNPSARAGSI